MLKTKLVLVIEHSKPIPELIDITAGRIYTLDGVEDVTAVAESAEEADMFWDAKDGDRFAHDIEGIVQDYGSGEEVRIQRAKRLPDIRVRVIDNSNDEGLPTYEVILAAIPASQIDGGKT